jgi:hypothetical protein
MERVKQLKRQQMEAAEQEKQRRASQNAPRDSTLGKSGKQPKKGQEKAVTADSLEADLNIPAELKEIIDDPDDDLQLKFDDPNDLMEIFTSLEEKNLFLINSCQNLEE